MGDPAREGADALHPLGAHLLRLQFAALGYIVGQHQSGILAVPQNAVGDDLHIEQRATAGLMTPEAEMLARRVVALEIGSESLRLGLRADVEYRHTAKEFLLAPAVAVDRRRVDREEAVVDIAVNPHGMRILPEQQPVARLGGLQLLLGLGSCRGVPAGDQNCQAITERERAGGNVGGHYIASHRYHRFAGLRHADRVSQKLGDPLVNLLMHLGVEELQRRVAQD
jgi:hypothetical protein